MIELWYNSINAVNNEVSNKERKMYTRYGNEYTENDIKELNAAKAQRQADADSEYAEKRKKVAIIVSGLQTKYGFSEKGAKYTMALIEQEELEGARFASEEMEAAAKRAYEYYWK